MGRMVHVPGSEVAADLAARRINLVANDQEFIEVLADSIRSLSQAKRMAQRLHDEQQIRDTIAGLASRIESFEGELAADRHVAAAAEADAILARTGRR
jgi:ubiquinone biosynthesis protein UbiJ